MKERLNKIKQPQEIEQLKQIVLKSLTPSQQQPQAQTLPPAATKKQLPGIQTNSTITQNPVTKEFAISLYTDPLATQIDIIQCIARLDASFPNSFKSANDKNKFYTILTERLISNNFTKQRLKEAVNYFIDTKTSFKDIHIADIVNFDKQEKLYSYHEKCITVQQSTTLTFNDFVPVKVNGIMYYRLKKI